MAEGFINSVARYREHLVAEERSLMTIEKYMRDIRAFYRYLAGEKLEKQAVLRYKAELLGRYSAASVNSMLTALNGYLRFLGREDCRVRLVKTQRGLFCAQEKELNKQEYARLLSAAKKRSQRLYLVMETICSTGIRVSELQFITCQAVLSGRAEVLCKGKRRTIFLPGQLCKRLKEYISRRGLRTGSVFVTRSGHPLDRSNIWADMKRLCAQAGVAPGKVFPHNLRHLFARTYYGVDKDLVRLADLLGHSSVDTTRIYMVSSGAEHVRRLDRLGLVLR